MEQEHFRLQPENPKQNAPASGAGPLGIPPPSPEGERPRGELTPQQTKPEQPRPKSAKGNSPAENVRLPKLPPAVFDCVVPEITIPPVHLRSMLRSGSITEDQAQQFEQEWRENLKTWDRQRMEEEVRDLKEERDDASRNKKQEQVQDVEYQLEALQEELRQRKAH